MIAINWNFLGVLESNALVGYVPKTSDGTPVDHSGVTIATGVDLGQCSVTDIASWGLPNENGDMNSLQRRCQRYALARGQAAVDLIFAVPLHISGEEAARINVHAQQHQTMILQTRYNAAVGDGVKYEDLPEPAQTVMMSVQYQYGDLEVKCPEFWKACVAADYAAMVDELNDFHDHFPTRRKKEAEYLSVLLTHSTEPDALVAEKANDGIEEVG